MSAVELMLKQPPLTTNAMKEISMCKIMDAKVPGLPTVATKS